MLGQRHRTLIQQLLNILSLICSYCPATRDVHPVLVQCCPTVYDTGTILIQQLVNVLSLVLVSNVGGMLCHRLRRWPNIPPPLDERFVFAGVM